MGWSKFVKKWSGIDAMDDALHKVGGDVYDGLEALGEDTWDSVKPVAGIIAGAALFLVGGPIALAAAWGSIIGSGLSTGMGLIQGQSWEQTGDASLKAGIIGGAAGGIGGAAGGAWGGSVASKLGTSVATGAKIVGGVAGGLTGAGLTAADGGTGMEVAMGGAGGAAAGWAGGGAVAKANLAARTSVATARAGGGYTYSQQVGQTSIGSYAKAGSMPYNAGIGGFETVQGGLQSSVMSPGATGFSAVPAGTFTPYTAIEQAVSQNAIAQSLSASLNPLNDPSKFALKAAMSMMMASAPMTESNLLTVQSMTEAAPVVSDSAIAPRGASPEPVLDNSSGGLAWDRTMGTLFGGTDLLASTLPRPTDKKTQAGVSDAMLTQNGALMV
jgi:hypothetical protein